MNTVKKLEPYQQRLLEETREEANKLHKLNMFMHGDIFPTLPRRKKELMYRQSRIMNEFVEVLGLRLEEEGIVFTHGVDAEWE